jgi:hypothetical protein
LATFTGILQAGAYSGFNALDDPGRQPSPVMPAPCWSHARRPFFELADIAKNARRGRSATAISLEAVERIDTPFEIERDIHGLSAAKRLAVRQERSAPLADLEAWLREQRAKLSRSPAVVQPIDYLLKRWRDFARFTEDGRICLTSNAAERALRCLALGRRAWLFAGSDRGAQMAAVRITLITTAKLKGIDPQTCWPKSSCASHPSRRAVCTNSGLGSGRGRLNNRQPRRLPEPEAMAARHRAHAANPRSSSDS